MFHRSHIPFQAPHLPPSSAVDPDRMKGPNLYGGRRGRTRFRFELPLPPDLPTSVTFCDEATLAYYLKAMCQVDDGATQTLVTKIARVSVKEQWIDWHEEKYLNSKSKEVSEVYADGYLTMEASIPRTLWCAGDEASVKLFLRNSSTKAVSATQIFYVCR